jgi:hypothetical protein
MVGNNEIMKPFGVGSIENERIYKTNRKLVEMTVNQNHQIIF